MRGVLRAAACVALALCAAPAAAAERVVAIGGAVTEIVYALGAGDRLVAADSTSVHPAAARALPRVGYLRQLSAEGVLSMRPQVVLAAAEAGPPAALAQIRASGTRVERLSTAHSFAALEENVRLAAAALGVPESGAALARRLEAEWRAASAAAGASPGPRVLFLLAHTGTNMMAAGRGTAADAMLRLAGAVNATAALEGYKALTPEAAIAAAPDVLLITSEGLAAIGGPEALWSRPGLALTPAAKHRRVVALDALYLLGFGPRLPQAVKELAERLRAARPPG